LPQEVNDEEEKNMTPKVILSYDGTPHDTDALVLGRLFAERGAEISLAYVRHVVDEDPNREERLQREAEALLKRGAQWLEQPDVPRHVVFAGSTGDGLAKLAEREGADMVVFGSDWHTSPGTVNPATSAQRLLDGGPVAVAIAAAHLRDRPEPHLARIAVAGGDIDPAARATAENLAAGAGTELVGPSDESVDLLVVGSRPGSPPGRVGVSSASEYLIETAGASVLVVPRGVAVRFVAPVALSV
jgi:nucleotide-binding universal stress UspA family protein